MALFKIFKGASATLPPIADSQDGWCYFTTDDGKFYIDYLDGDTLRRRAINGPGQNIEYIEGTQASNITTAAWTGVTKDPALYDGKIILYKLPAASTSNATLKLTFTNPISSTASDAISVYLNNETRVNSQYQKNSVFLMVYEANQKRWRAHGQWNTSYSAMSTSEAWTGTATNSRVLSAAQLKAIFANLGGTGLILKHNATDGIRLDHTNVVAAKTAYGSTATTANANGGKITVTDITYDTEGHITGSQDREITLSQNDYRVRQVNDASTDANYRLLLSNGANNNHEDQISRKNANLIYNPSTNKLSTGNLKLTGAIDVTGNATFHNQTNADSLTAGSLIVNGNTHFVQSPIAPTPANGDNSTKLATTAFVKTAIAGLAGAMHFKGTTSTAIADGSTTKPVTIGSASYTPVAGDVVLYSDSEFVWTGTAWERLGRDSSFKVTQSAVDSGQVVTNTWISRIQQDANGKITTTMGTLDTSGTWTGNAATATAFSSNTTVSLTGDATGTSSGSTKGWSVPVTLANSGVTAGTYGNTTQQTPSHGETFNIPYFKVDAKGRVISASTTTVKLPTDNNTDTKVNVVARDATKKAYLLADTTAPTSTAAAHTAVAETGVYLDKTAGKLVASTFKGDLEGNAATATNIKPISLTWGGAKGNNTGYRLIYTFNIAAWSHAQMSFICNSRHGGAGLISIAVSCRSATVSQDNVWADIRYWGSDDADLKETIPSNIYQIYVSADGTKAYLFWYHYDYSACNIYPLGGDAVNIDNGPWMTSIDTATYGALKAQTLTSTDEKVQQTSSSTEDADYRILFSGTADDITRTEGTKKNTNLKYNPSTNTLSTNNLALTDDLNVTGDTTFTKSPTAPTPAPNSNDTHLATTAFVMNAFTANDAMIFKGVVNSNSELPATHKQGWTYRAGTAGVYAGEICEVGDIIICVTDGTAANVNHWAVIQTNIDGAVTSSSTSSAIDNIPVFSTTTGKVIADSGRSIAHVPYIVKTIADRDAIPSDRRCLYMKATVEEDGETYTLVGGLTNEYWVRESAAATTMGTYKWCINSELDPPLDEVHAFKDGAWTNTGKTLKDFGNENYNGTWFYISNTADDTVEPAGRTRYKLISDGYTNTGYDIDGANGYLSCREYVIWVGRWIKVPIYECKASDYKNPDGLYSPKYGVDGIMSSTQAAYLTDLMQRYIAACDPLNGRNSGNDCGESGLYGHINLGRPSGTSEILNLISIKDKNNQVTSQWAVGQDSNRAFVRGNSGNAWQRLLSDKDLITQLGVSESADAWSNWLTQPGIYKVTIRDDDGACPPTTNGRDFIFIVMSGALNATTQTAITQIAMNRLTREIYLRYASGYSGSGSLSGIASEWIPIVDALNGWNVNGALYKVGEYTGGEVLLANGQDGAVSAGKTSTQEVVKTASLSGGASPTLGTPISTDDITEWNAGTVTTASVANGVLTIATGTASSLAYTARSIPNVTAVGSMPTLSTTKQSVITKISL